jgi:hypothetical protein
MMMNKLTTEELLTMIERKIHISPHDTAYTLRLASDKIKELTPKVIIHPDWLHTGCPDHNIPRCQCCCDDWYMDQLGTMVENA